MGYASLRWRPRIVAATVPAAQIRRLASVLEGAERRAGRVPLNLNKLQEVSPFSYEIGTGGKIIDDAKINNGSWNGWFSAAHELGVKIIPTVAWFDGAPMYDLLSNTNARQAHEDAIAALAKTPEIRRYRY